MLLDWKTSSSIVKQNDCKNKTTWLTQTDAEDIKKIFKVLFFV